MAKVGFEPTSLEHESRKEPLLYFAIFLQDTFYTLFYPAKLLNLLTKIGFEPMT